MTTGTNVLDKQGRVKDAIRTRAEIYGCRVLTAEQIRQLASDAATVETVREAFFGAVRE